MQAFWANAALLARGPAEDETTPRVKHRVCRPTDGEMDGAEKWLWERDRV